MFFMNVISILYLCDAYFLMSFTIYLSWDVGVTTHYLLIYIKASTNMRECVTKKRPRWHVLSTQE